MSARRNHPCPPRRLGWAGLTGVLTVGVVVVAALPAGATPITKGVSRKSAALARFSAHRATTSPVAAEPAAVRRALSAHRTQLAKASARAKANVIASSTPSDLTVTGTAGVLTFSATSSAAFVSFAVDGTAVAAPVAVAPNGSVRMAFASWGYPNGVPQVTAADCATVDINSCDVIDADSASFTLDNAKPTVTGPRNGAEITGGFTISATSSGGALAFLVDGDRRGFDATSPYRFLYTGSALSPGRHTISVEQCSVSGTQCAGPQSTRITITSNGLRPKITSLSPRTFSPNRDHVKDTTTLTFALPDTENAEVTVTNAHGTVVRGPLRLGALRKGRHTWTWAGTAHSGKFVSSGRYKLTLNTSATLHGVVVTGQVWAYAVVDRRPPVVSGLTGSSSVYPIHDGFRDTFTAGFHLDERASVTLTVRNAHRRTVRTIRSTHNPGHVSMRWSGRDAHGHIVPSGTYTWFITVRDAVGNTRRTTAHHVGVSSRRLVSEKKTITKNGDSFYSAGASDTSCAEASTSLSDYAHGVWLSNSCFADDDVEIAAAFYHVTLPSWATNSRISVQVNGFALSTWTSVVTGFGVNGGSSDFGFGDSYEIAAQGAGWYGIGSIDAAHYMSAHHVANIAVNVDNVDAPCDFDINQVRITVTSKVLR
jgi:flagellar hook assembly protein FlgD